MLCFFVSDLHGHRHRYEALFDRIAAERPDALFIGGDLLPSHARSAGGLYPHVHDFIADYLSVRLKELRTELGEHYPGVFLIPGNDDARMHETQFRDARYGALWAYMHDMQRTWKKYEIYGYACVPPTPFLLKDWERYDVSRYVDPGCIPPEDGRHTVPVDKSRLRYATIEEDLKKLTGDAALEGAIMLFHSPPYQTVLDRAALDGKTIDHAPLDVHVGSVAIRRFIERRQPRITLHGHIHESAGLTGHWKQQIAATWCFSAAHRGCELALVRFDPDSPAEASRELL